MSWHRFEEVYSPTAKKLIIGSIDNRLVANLFIAGDYASRLHVCQRRTQSKARVLSRINRCA